METAKMKAQSIREPKECRMWTERRSLTGKYYMFYFSRRIVDFI
jgi:hypothetical protein